MKLESILIKNFRCFGPQGAEISFDNGVTTFVGGNGSGKTAAFEALSRLFGISNQQRFVKRRDFHIPSGQAKLESGTSLSIEVILGFPELDGLDEGERADAVPEFFLQMAATAPAAPLKARIRLNAVWTDDGTPDGTIEEEVRWIRTLGPNFVWEECEKVQAVERGSIQLIYVPASRDVSSPVTSLLKGRLWQAAKWSDDFRNRAARHASAIQKRFVQEEPAKYVTDRLAKRWKQVNEADTDTEPLLRLVENRFEELIRRAEFVFYPNEEGKERELLELSDGQRSLFYIALTATTLEVERDIFAGAENETVFDIDKLRRVHLTLLAVEEPENSLSPFFLSRIIEQARDIAALSSAQVLLSSHSPAMLSRIESEEVRYFRLNRQTRRSSVRALSLPSDDAEASQFVRLAVRAYPELYFARFVILAEGDSERIVIPRIADAMGICLDPSFVPIVPLGGRYVSHFWTLLKDLDIPHATLLDLDLGRRHGGANTIRTVVSALAEIGNDLSENLFVFTGEIVPDDVGELDNDAFTGDAKDNKWFQALQAENVFFSDPIDLDFAMLVAFPNAYQHPHPGGRGPRQGDEALNEKKAVTLKTGGDPSLFSDDYDEAFRWYPYLFLDRSKPEAHLLALTRIADEELRANAPPELKVLIEHAKQALKTQTDDE